MEDLVLLGTFVSSPLLPKKCVRDIFNLFKTSRKVFIFKLTKKEQKLEELQDFLLTFNLKIDEKDEALEGFKTKYKNTIQLHRKKETNTLYTINSLNEIVKAQHGKVGKELKVDWTQHRDCCIVLSKENNLKILPINLVDIFVLNS